MGVDYRGVRRHREGIRPGIRQPGVQPGAGGPDPEANWRRWPGRLERRYGTTVQVIPADLSQAGSAQRVYDELLRRDIRVEQLVNNAGAGKQSRVVDAEPDTMAGLIELNVTSVTLLCRLIGADMASAGHGRILNVSSLGAFIPDPYFNVYGPTKAYELFLTLAMAGELKGTGVTVSALCPGPVKTDWARRAGKADSRLAKDPAEIARIGYLGMQRGRLVIVPTLLYKAERRAMALLPFRAQVGMIRNGRDGSSTGAMRTAPRQKKMAAREAARKGTRSNDG